jgi:hypothetical protein
MPTKVETFLRKSSPTHNALSVPVLVVAAAVVPRRVVEA